MKERVLVKWHDAKFCSGALPEDEILGKKMAVFESIGYLIARDNYLTIY